MKNKMLTALTNGTIYTGKEVLAGKSLIIENDKIKAIVDNNSLPTEAINIKDCSGRFIAPGLIDLQIAGGGGYLFSNRPSAESLKAITESITKTGTTGFLLAIPTDSMEVYTEAIKVIKENPHPAVLGLHLEGPYISPKKSGAHPKQYIRQPQKKEVEDLLALADGTIKMITLAPEMCDPEIIKLLNDNNVTVSAGHSNASFKEAVEGYRNGVRTTTHLFNAMSSLHHRNPGLPGAAYMTEGAYAGIIADGIHVDFNIVSISKKIMRDRLFLVTDAVEECHEGNYIHVRQKDRFTLPDGTLSGSCLTMLKAVKNCVEKINIDIEEALRMASAYPAKVMNMPDRGLIKAGLSADLVVFNKDFSPDKVFVNGKTVL